MTTKLRKADTVSQDLLSRIVRGELPVGSVLPTESELADHYQVNRSVVREAVKSLEVHRLVEPVRRRGTTILDPLASLSPEVLRAMLIDFEGRIDLSVLAEVLEVRATLDVRMAALAAQNRQDSDLAAFEKLIKELEDSFETPVSYAIALRELPLILSRASGQRIFSMLVHWHERVSADLGHLMEIARRPSLPHLQGLRTLTELIAARDSETVSGLVRAFHAWASPLLLEEARRRNEQISSIQAANQRPLELASAGSQLTAQA